jgi:hypothetical protein
MFRARQQGAKHLALGCSWCHWKGLETKISKMPSHWQIGHLKPKLWAKEGPGVKLAVWLPTTKSRESMSSRCPIRECNTALERSWRGLQFRFIPRRDSTLQSGVMAVQSPGSPTGIKSGLHFGSPGNLCHLDAPSVASCREYYREYGGGILPSQGCGESKWVRVPVAYPNTKKSANGF